MLTTQLLSNSQKQKGHTHHFDGCVSFLWYNINMLTEIREKLGYKDSSKDNLILLKIKEVQRFIEGMVGRGLFSKGENLVERISFLNGVGYTNTIPVREFVRFTNLAGGDVDIKYKIDTETGEIQINSNANDLMMEYVGGYENEDIPFDLVGAIVSITAREIQQNGIGSRSINANSATYENSLTEIERAAIESRQQNFIL